MQPSFRGLRGMQVHAVPDSEKAYDASGRKLPWAYELSAGTESREPLEKGPFGRSQRRSRSGLSRSRSKTAEPRKEEERLKVEQLAAEEAVFGSLRRVARDDGRREGSGDAEPVAAAITAGEGEATEVMLFGFGQDLQWAAIDFYERVSGGNILEDYDRQPAGRRYDISRSLSRATSQQSLSKAALRKKNRYAGGEHWIKVTFSSRDSADLACARSPHVIKGHLVYAEPYLGRGPKNDEPIPASNAGAQITGTAVPASFSTNTLNASPTGSSATATSATATATGPAASGREFQRSYERSERLWTMPQGPISSNLQHDRRDSHLPTAYSSSSQAIAPTSTQTRMKRFDGATAAVVLPASAAILPKQPKQSWSAWLGAGDVIGSTVPKRDDGTFDWAHASLYWKFFYCIDMVFGTDFCALKLD